MKGNMTKTPVQFLNRWASTVFVTAICSLFSVAVTDASQGKPKESILDLKIESLKVDNGDMEEALRLLRQKDPYRILIGFEEVPHREGEKGKNISVELTDATVVEILDRLCEADPRYTYEVVSDALINVFPRGAKSDPNNLLNMIVRDFEVNEYMLPHNLIIRIGEWAPELREYLRLKAEEHARKTGRPIGIAGSILSGNAPLPRISLKLQNMTVREILNAIVLYSMKMKISYVSWKYEFIIAPDAPTGLGGYPRWDIF
jgi:hypothetical protein